MTINPISTIIIGPSGRFRDSLRVLLNAGDQISLVGQTDNVASGLRMIDTNRPLLMLLDASLPDAHAWQVLKQVKCKWPSLGYLVLTHTQEQQHLAQSAGADRILMDGFSTESLLDALRETADEMMVR